jgi:dCMP deaminase
MADATRKELLHMKWTIEGARLFSTCGKRQYMAVILDSHGHLIGTGYNGGPKGMIHCNEGGCPRLSADSNSGSLYNNCISIHAEANALLHSDYTARFNGGTMIVNGTCCYDCAKLISNSGLKRLVYIPDPQYELEKVLTFFAETGIEAVPIPEDLF